MKTEYIAIIIMIIIALGLLYYGYTTFLKNKRLNEDNVSSINVKELIEALGGKENIQELSSSLSKLIIVLKNQKIIDVAKIQELGASGIVQGKENVSLIFGKQSALIEQDIHKLLR